MTSDTRLFRHSVPVGSKETGLDFSNDCFRLVRMVVEVASGRKASRIQPFILTVCLVHGLDFSNEGVGPVRMVVAVDSGRKVSRILPFILTVCLVHRATG
ncbi:hypothetical protein AVEN_28831-1 [Araneus ventricosus]|uniref:Uncharacterized protein n=1 Tax=Araneus ventricosus TaxID=182803 RepID=A0A4Y2SK79_ARAVE|nr:hypothetical protein AVEN_28831-1 [Araneus ventricosus]